MKRIVIVLLFILALSIVGQAQSNPPLKITEVDGSPSRTNVTRLNFPNGSLTVSGQTVTYTPAGGSGLGDVVGPASATDNAIVRFDLTTGKLIQNSVVTIADTSGNMAGVGTLNTHTIPGGTDTFALLAATQSLSNKTFVAPVLGVATATSLTATGAVQGVLSDKGGQVFNVKAYGATGDGTTNDAVAIQAAADAANAVHGRVYFPHGTYAFSTALNFDSFVSVMFEGETGPVWLQGNQKPGAYLLWKGAGSGVAISCKGSNGVLFKHLGILYDSATFTGTLIHGGETAGQVPSAHFGIEHSYVAAADYAVLPAKALLSLAGAVGAHVYDSTFAGAQSAIRGVETSGSVFSNAVVIRNTEFDICSFAFLTNIGLQWSIDHCTFEFTTGATPSAIDSDITVTSDFVIMGQTGFWDQGANTQIPIRQRVGNTWHATITDCFFDVFEQPNIKLDGPGRITITNNSFTSSVPAQAASGLIDLGSSGTALKQSVVISGNHWAINSGSAITNITGHQNVNIFGNDSFNSNAQLTIAGPLQLVETGFGKKVSLLASASMGSDYSLTWPTAAPSANKSPLLVSTAGLMSYPTGTPDGTKFLRDDGTWATTGGGAGATVALDNLASPAINVPLAFAGDANVTIGARSAGLIDLISGGTSKVEFWPGGGRFGITSDTTLMFGSTSSWATSSVNAGISLISSGLLGIGDGSNGSFAGNLKLTVLNAATGIQINGAAASRKMLVGNGTNFVASTETWAVPGTSGNVLTSDGTNWTSAAAAGGGSAGGSDTQVQFNDGGTAFGGDAGLVFNKTTNVLSIIGGGLILSGNQSSAAWTTNGLRIQGVAATLTDTTSSGTVAAAYTNNLGGNTIAASSTTTFTNYYTTYMNDPVAGTNVTLTNKWAIGGDSLKIGTNLLVPAVASGVDGITITGAATANPAFVQILASGSDSNINVAILNKGSNTGLAIGGVTSSHPMFVPLANGNLRLVNATFGAGKDLYVNQLYAPNDTTPLVGIQNSTQAVDLGSLRVIAWRSVDATNSGSDDTGLSRSSAGVIAFGTAAQGSTAGSWLATNGTLSNSLTLGTAAARSGTAGTNRLDIFNGTAPTGTLANGISLFSASGELNVIDAAANVTLLSPHDLTTNEWIFYSHNSVTGKTIRIDMERLMKAIDAQLGGGFVKEYIEKVN